VVVIEPVVIAEFMAAVAPAFERTLVKAGDSFLSDGKRVGADRLHMIDDGLLVGAMETRAFDRRGVPSLDLPLIREGAVGALYQSVEVARELNGRPSGHEGAAGPWPGNLVLRPGTRSRNMIYPELGRYLLLDSRVDDGKAWFNLKTGKLRLQAHFFSGIAGEDPVYVGVHTIQTSFIELWSGIREIANDQRRFGSVDVSTWLVEGLRLS
jgi:predicted Zn-dependent protease